MGERGVLAIAMGGSLAGTDLLTGSGPVTVSPGDASDRLRTAGVGPLAPAAYNSTEEGRARNRRVELVER